MQKLTDATDRRAQTLLQQLCKTLKCSQIADDLERVSFAREKLATLQEQEILSVLFCEETETRRSISNQVKHSTKNLSEILKQTKAKLSFAAPTKSSVSISEASTSNVRLTDDIEEVEDGEYEYEYVRSVKCEAFSDDAWLGYFRGYDILDERQEYVLGENKQCVLLSPNDDQLKLDNYLRNGIRCFAIDLFYGTELENQRIIYNLRESELRSSREYGFPVVTTLFAMLSPRLQYTGIMNEDSFLNVSDELTITTKRKYSSCSTRSMVYVNAFFLIEDCKVGDFILIGPDIQVTVIEVSNFFLKCKVVESGVLQSRLPVRFPARCNRNKLSIEELEDMTFAREVGINILVCYIPGTPQYFEELTAAFRLLDCEKMRLFTRIVLNDFKGDIKDFEWIAESYDGFYIDFKPEQETNVCSEPVINLPDFLKLSEGADDFLKKAYHLMKPIILNPLLMAKRELHVQPYDVPHIFYYPDKYIFSVDNFDKSFFFHLLQNAMVNLNDIPQTVVQEPYYCDQSESGDNSLARACVFASFKCQAKAIAVCSSMPDTVIKLSHFRPQAPIILISSTKSIGDYISVYHNIFFLRFYSLQKYEYKDFVTKCFMFVLIYLKQRWQLRQNDNILLVYSTVMDAKLCDKYVIYKFDEQQFPNHLEEILFR